MSELNALGRALMMGSPDDITTGNMLAGMPEKSLARMLMDAARSTQNRVDALPWWVKAPVQPFVSAGEAGLGTIATGASGAENVRRGINEDDPWRTAGGIGELGLAGLSVLPAAGPVGRTLMGTAPRAMATMVPLAGLSLLPGVANARDRKEAEVAAFQPPPHLSGELTRARQELQEMMQEQARLNQKHRRDPAETQRQFLEPINKRIDEGIKKISTIEGAIRAVAEQEHAKVMSERPFRERNPELTAGVMAGGLSLAFGLPFAKTAMSRISQGVADRRTNRLADAVIDGALPGKAGPNTTAMDTAMQLDILRRRMDGKPPGFWDKASDATKTAAWPFAGGLAVGEASIFPEQYDKLTYGPEHPTRQAAERMFHDENYWKDRAVPFMTGASVGLMGNKIGGFVPRGGLDRPKIDAALNIGNARLTDDAQMIQRLRDFQPTRVIADPQPPPVGPPTGPSSTQGPGQLPPPTGGPSGTQGPQPPTQPRQANSDRWAYEGSEQQVRVQQAIAEQVGKGKAIPTLDELRPHLARDGARNPVPGHLQQRLDNLTEIVTDLKTIGTPDDQIASFILKLMQSGKHKLPAIAAGTIGLSAMQFGDEPR